MTQQFKAMKIRIKGEQHSRLVQEALFEMGYTWGISGQSITYTDKEVIYAECNGEIFHGTLGYFHANNHEEVELITTYSFKAVDQEAKRKAAEKETLQKNVAEMQKQLDEMKQKLESM